MIQFIAHDRKRRSVRLGKVTMKQAEAIYLRVEHLAAAATTGYARDIDMSRWVAGLSDDLSAKLAAVGLIPARQSSTLGPFLDGYFKARTDVKPQTQVVWRQTRRNLLGHFGPAKPLRDINRGDADEWRLKLVDEGLADSTIRKRSGFAKQFFAFAVKKKLIPSNPFAELKSAATGNPKRFHFVTREQTAVVIDGCPDAKWRLIVALARFGGMRCPSEPFALKWADVDWSRNRMTVTSPKTEHHEGKGSRVVPIFPELRPYLEPAFDAAEPGTIHVIARHRNANLRTRFEKIIKRAGLTPWPRLFQNLRSTRQTELEERFPTHVVCRWMGNSPQVAQRHYLQETEDHFVRALGRRCRKRCRGGAFSGAARDRPASLVVAPKKANPGFRRGYASQCDDPPHNANGSSGG